MGRIIKKISSAKIADDQQIDFEVNIPPHGRGEDIVHIQSDRFRAEFSKSDFIEIAAAIISSAYHLKKIKKK